MKLEKDLNWISADFFSAANPHPVRITDVVQRDSQFSKGKTDTLVFIKSELSGDIVVTSIFKKNKNILIDKFGDDTDKWIGKVISIKQTEEVGGQITRDMVIPNG